MKRFPNGSRVCFIGDSLVHENKTLSWIIDSYRNTFPNEDIRFFNCGTAGGTAEFALKIFEDDVLRVHPTHAVVAFGINDSWRWNLREEKGTKRYNTLKLGFETYKKCIKELCDKILENNIELILCTPAPYDEYEETEQPAFKGGYTLMSEYSNFIRNFAHQNNYILCDYYEAMVEIMQTDKLYNADHVHPTDHGYYRMAEIFLNKQGMKISHENDITKKFPKWGELVPIYRNIYMAECMVLKKAELPISDKLQIARDFISQNEDKLDIGRNRWFVSLCKDYLQNREKSAEMFEKIEKLYQEEILK
jgi:lysophospholipase L1-like esterase